MAEITLYICTTCRKGGARSTNDETRDGAELFDRLSQETLPENVALEGVECLSACDNGCNIALSSKSRWSYVYGKLDPNADIHEILMGLKAYAKTNDGIVPWRERPEIFRKQSIARIPPMEGVSGATYE